MAKQSMFEGKNGVQQSSHIRTISRATENGGSPSTKTNHGSTNPYNSFQGDAAGVLGPDVVAQNAPANDSPVPAGHQMPELGSTKSGVAAPAGGKTSFPSDGVLGRGV
jgi:hypothetical protein